MPSDSKCTYNFLPSQKVHKILILYGTQRATSHLTEIQYNTLHHIINDEKSSPQNIQSAPVDPKL